MKKIAVFLLLTLMSVVFSGCWIQEKLQSGVEEVNQSIEEVANEIGVQKLDDTKLAFGLLTLDEVKTIDEISNVHPSLIEFNDHLDNNREDVYVSFIARQWMNPLTGNVRIGNAITNYSDANLAQSGLEKLAGDAERIEEFAPVGDKNLLLYEKANDEFQLPAGLTYRFTLENYSVRVTVYTILENATDDEIQKELLPIVEVLAKAQYERLSKVLNGSIIGPETNPAMEKLPEAIAGTDLIGTATVSALEWRGVEGSFEESGIPGFKSGALSVFKMQSRPDELVEITVMEFDTQESAKNFQQQLLPEGVAPIKLSEALDETSDAISFPGGFELQSFQGNYMIDVSIFAPFGEIAEESVVMADMEKITTEIISGFLGL